MTLKKLYIAPIKGYQYLSKMIPASCRYYPTCSEYASWQFELNRPYKAFIASGTRILRCNQFFKGGIDYPLITLIPQQPSCIHTFNPDYGKIDIVYWLVPKSKNTYYIVKDFDAIKRTS